jgi:hypothetical protein
MGVGHVAKKLRGVHTGGENFHYILNFLFKQGQFD